MDDHGVAAIHQFGELGDARRERLLAELAPSLAELTAVARRPAPSAGCC
jgi:hypothetical protein